MTWLVAVLAVFGYFAIGKLVAIFFDSDDCFEDRVICLIMWPVFLLVVGLIFMDAVIGTVIHRRKGE